MSSSISLNAYRWYLAQSAWLLKRHVSAEQSVIRVNGLARTYDANLSTAQSIARHSRFVAAFFASGTGHLWLA